jgi:hypothetical protein
VIALKASRRWDDLDDLRAAVDDVLDHGLDRTALRSVLPDESPFRCSVRYLGAYAYWDLPAGAVDYALDLEILEDCVADDRDDLPAIEVDRPPPAAQAWTS